MEHARHIAGKALIKDSSGRVLVLRQSDEAAVSNAGRYQLPGGIIDIEESITSGIEREVKEETGLIATVEELRAHGEWTVNIRGEIVHIVGLFFACTVEDIDNATIVIDPDESSGFMWVDKNTMSSIDIVEPARSIIAAQFQ